MTTSSPSNPSTVKRLSGLLQQPQEPFNLEVYLLEKGCSSGRRRLMDSQATLFCWPVNAAKRLPRKLSSHGVRRRGRAANFLRHAFAKLVYGKAIRKALQWNINTPYNGSGTPSHRFHEDSKQQLSPVSVLELQHSDVSSTVRNLNKYTSTFLWEAEEKIWGCNGCLSSQMFEEAMCELILSWERQKGDVVSLTQMVALELSSRVEEWSQFKPEAMQIGLCLEAAIFDDIREEAFLDM